MTASPAPAPLAFATIEDVAAAIRAGGGRLSAAGRRVLEALFEADRPIPAALIADRVADGGSVLDLASAYRNLERLEALGVVRHVHLGHGPGLYALVGCESDAEYLVCERCDGVLAVDPAELDAVRSEIHERFGYEARFTHFPIAGVCPECAEADPA
jgi:Fur family ferric uptake transcriptional regulator